MFATAELAPIASVGGLAQAAAGLVAELRRQGVDVDVVMPDYGGIELADTVTQELSVPPWAGPARVRTGKHADVGQLSIVEAPGLARAHPYLQPDGHGWPDNDRRFLTFCQAVAAIVRSTRSRRRAPQRLAHRRRRWPPSTARSPSVLSIHNLAYQGFTDGAWLRHLGPRGGHYEWFGGTNPLSGAIALADAIVAVSPNHAREILTPDGGFGLDGALRHRWDAVSGILNGIDTDDLGSGHRSRTRQPTIRRTTKSAERTIARAANRAAVRDRAGFPSDDVPLAVMVTRLTGQKGADLLVPIVPILRSIPLRLVVLGSGEADIAERLAAAAADDPEWFSFVNGYDEQFAHLLHGGGDLLLVPEPLRAVRPHADAGDALRGDSRRHRRRRAARHGGRRRLRVRRHRLRRPGGDIGGVHRRRCSGPSRHLATARRRNALSGRGMKLDWSWSATGSRVRRRSTNGSLGRVGLVSASWPNRESS